MAQQKQVFLEQKKNIPPPGSFAMTIPLPYSVAYWVAFHICGSHYLEDLSIRSYFGIAESVDDISALFSFGVNFLRQSSRRVREGFH